MLDGRTEEWRRSRFGLEMHKNYKPVLGSRINGVTEYYDKPQELKSLIKFTVKKITHKSARCSPNWSLGIKEIQGLKFYIYSSCYTMHNIGRDHTKNERLVVKNSTIKWTSRLGE